ncbi:MAG: T9SS type A sorting domain-containing protein, partial [Ignavibacteria bacterium]|nr:T9SS type A sorting domain-containing protein [Ignavibacteria bacterium]
ISGSQLPSRYPTDIHVNHNNSADVYVTMGGFGSGHVYRSVNAGVSWSDISGNLPDVPHQTVCIDPLYPGNIYVGNDLGVYASSNGGASWFEFRTGMPYSLVFDLTIVYPSRNIRAVTHGNGVYERDLMSNIVGVSAINSEVPKQFSLGQNYPNPFNPETKIRFQISGSSAAQTFLSVYDINGKEISLLVNADLKPGSYEISFDASGLSSGVYFYKISAGSFTDVKKMVLVK